MKKKDKKLLDEINTSLKSISDGEKLPEILSEENIAAVVDNQEQSVRAKMSAKQKRITAFATCAAVAVLCCCAVLAHKAAKNPTAVVPVPTTNQPTQTQFGDAPLYMVSSYSVIEQRFEGYAKKYRDEMKEIYKTDGVIAKNDSAEGVTAAEDNSTAAPSNQGGGEVAEGGAGGAGGAGGSNENDFSLTNVQVKGVDEADIIKTDGKYIYTVSEDFEFINPDDKTDTRSNDCAVKIVDIQNPEEMKVVASVLPTLPGSEIMVEEIYVSGNNLILVSNAWEAPEQDEETKEQNHGYYYSGYDAGRTFVTVYDITDRAEPKEKGRYTQSGYYMSSRLIDNRVYILSNYEVSIYGETDRIKKTCIPMYGEGDKFERVPVEDICIMSSSERTGYLVVGSINFYGDEMSSTVKAVLGGGEEAYCTKDSLYVSNSVYDYQLYTDDQKAADDFAVDMGRTEIFAFLLNEGRIEYKAYGTVSGVVNDQFSMDEYNGYFRIATTVGWNGYSIVTVLDKNLKRTGELTKIAEGEQIYSVRFMGDTGYVVTFRNTDPLFVIDLSDPTKPTVTGELEVPGFSNYLHPVSDRYILGIGEDRDEDGNIPEEGWNTKLSVFDVSDPANPEEVSTLVLRGSSEAQYTHKALTVLPDGSFIIPMDYDGINDDTYRAVHFSISQRGRITLLRSYESDFGEVREPDSADDAENETVFSNYMNRVVYSNSVVFTRGSLYIEAFSVDSGRKLGDVQLTDTKKLADRDSRFTAYYTYNDMITADGLAETTEAVSVSEAG
jgi:uncharacterized secreted protein with C-terminal beta-propeller domain